MGQYYWVIGVIGVLLTFIIFMAGVIYKTGHLAARVEELERWRINIRQDFHEVSEELQEVNKNLMHLATVIEERTERRVMPRVVK